MVLNIIHIFWVYHILLFIWQAFSGVKDSGLSLIRTLRGNLNLFELYGEFGLGEVGHFWNILATETGITSQSKGLGVGVQKDKYVRHISLHFSFLK